MFEDIVAELGKTQAEYRLAENRLRVSPNRPDGFETVIRRAGDEGYEVYLDDWHEFFESYEEASRCFLFALSGRCRIKRMLKGTFPFRWTLEALTGSQLWEEESTTGLLFYPFWRRTKVTHLQNDPVFEGRRTNSP